MVGYAEGATLFSFSQNKFIKSFHHQSAGGGTSARLIQTTWHPTGTFVVTGHDDGTLVIWDPKDGRQIHTQTLDFEVPQAQRPMSVGRGAFAAREPLFKVVWCAKENPDDTCILIAGGRPSTELSRGLTFIELGQTPVYNTSSWQVLTDHFAKPNRQHLLPTPPNAEVVDFCLIPRKSPHFAGASDPIAVIAVLASGELVTMSFPSGHPITPTNQLHVSLTFVHPFVDHIAMGYVDRTRWLGLTEKRNHGLPVLRGGAEAKHSLMRYAHRNIIMTAHADGTVRLYDVGHGDEIENEDVLQLDVARAVGRYDNIDVSCMAVSGATGELVVGLRSGEVVIFRWARNANFGREVPHQASEGFGLEVIEDRAEPSVKEGLLPFRLFSRKQKPVIAVKISDVGFVCAGFEDGSIAVIDLRGPAVIFDAALHSLGSQGSKRSSLRPSGRGQTQGGPEWSTTIEFGVMSLEGEGTINHDLKYWATNSLADYSSILLFVGTTIGRVVTLKLLPEASGTYAVKFAGSSALEGNVVSLSSLNIDTGEPAEATQEIVGSLRNGLRVNGVLVAVTGSAAHIFKPSSAKGAHKFWDEFICYKAAVARFETHTCALVGLFGDGTVKAFSIPGLKEIASTQVSKTLDVRRLSDAIITPTGFIFGFTGPSEIATLNVWGTGQDL